MDDSFFTKMSDSKPSENIWKNKLKKIKDKVESVIVFCIAYMIIGCLKCTHPHKKHVYKPEEKVDETNNYYEFSVYPREEKNDTSKNFGEDNFYFSDSGLY